MTIGWQDLVVALAAVVAGAWLFLRWRAKRRVKAGCDTCAAAMHARIDTARAKETSPR